MRAIIQRVAKASVTVGDEQISSIGRGICVLLGISVEDTQKDVDYMIRKILNLRIFTDESGKPWCKSVMDKQYEVLCVSQFTLQCILKGNKPDYHMAMPSEQAEPFYNDFLQQMSRAYKPELIKDGRFGAYMQVNIQNDGPVTIELESPASATDPKYVLSCFHSLNERSDEKFVTISRAVSANVSSYLVQVDQITHLKLTKLEKQQQRKEKIRTKAPSESSREKSVPRTKEDPSASSGAEGDVSSEREP
uniref:D-aminoacyl-tRNA deacylase n=1 Tax=Leptobrachium leishanense TaxID=445787 RepID=A0A8C5MEZ6_9ANUR